MSSGLFIDKLNLLIASDFKESRLFWNNGDGTFTDGSTTAGIGKDDNGMGSAIGDFNGDGLLDWFVTSIYEFDNNNFTGNKLYINGGDRTFFEHSESAHVSDGGWGWGASALDYDRDGDLDVFVVNHAAKPVLYRNDNGKAGNWLEIRTTGLYSNRDGIGAFITVVPDSKAAENFIVREVDGGSNFLSQSERIAHFGLGDHEGFVDRVTIRWPSGSVQNYEDIPVNALFEAREAPDPFLFFEDAVVLGGDWVFTKWFGSIYAGDFPWIFHPEHGWLFCAGRGGDKVWLWDMEIGWLGTAPETYPFLYSIARASWLWYDLGSARPRYFFDFKSNLWFEVD